MHVQYEMIPCSGFIEVQNVRTSTKGTIQHKGSSCAAT